MSEWQARKGREVLAALRRSGWVVIWQRGSHKTLAKEGRDSFIFAFGDGHEIGPRMMARIAKLTGLEPGDFR